MVGSNVDAIDAQLGVVVVVGVAAAPMGFFWSIGDGGIDLN